ncbi:MAG: patatin-like phospholipase family protein [Sphingobacteriaceae bacterium]|nr:patatin-like phospholipase family protein [Sphingobacteriaceae bacterium]
MFRFLFFVLFLCPGFIQPAAAQRPKVGLALSGGGAKGLAHIGVLQAIDSAGLSIDFIAGTSMGGVVGALYATGYSGNAIDSIARAVDWNVIFSTAPDMSRIPVDKKKENEEQSFEIRMKNRKVQIPSGMLESQELWLLLSELLMPAYAVKDFNKLSIPFRCVATDVLTGDAVVHADGNLVYAVRSSMAIPSIFTAIDFEGMKLIDGGVVRNFPVKDVRSMGAQYIIGSNVSAASLPADQMNSAINILYQTAFLRSSEDFKEEVKLLNMFINIDLERFSAGSFFSSDSILAIGKAAGDSYYPYFKRLADSLNAIQPKPFKANRLNSNEKILIRGMTITGLETTTRTAFLERLGLRANLEYTPAEISEAIREVFAMRLYKSITYELIPNPEGGASIVFKVQEHPPVGISGGFHYNTFSNIALVANYRVANLLTDKSESTVRLALGDNSHLMLRQEHYIGQRLNHKITAAVRLDRVFFPEFVDYSQRQLYRESMATMRLQYDRLIKRNRLTGVGIEYVAVSWRPRFFALESKRIDNSYFSAYYQYKRNDLSTLSFPDKGFYAEMKTELIFKQRPFLEEIRPESRLEQYGGTGLGEYFRGQWRIESYHPINKRMSWFVKSSGGVNFTTTEALFNFWNVGGQYQLFRNQITFAGFREYELQSNGFGMLQLGVQRQIASRLFLLGKINSGASGLNRVAVDFEKALIFAWGTSASLGYRSPIGPVDLSLNYNITTNSWIGLLNLGWWF